MVIVQIKDSNPIVGDIKLRNCDPSFSLTKQKYRFLNL